MNNKKSWVILVIVLVIAVIGLIYIFNSNETLSPNPQVQVPVTASAYQAVFLINNQVYFGKLSNENSDFITLEDIYYLQINQNIQPKDANASNPEINLVKLGGELHGPTDEMRINRDQVLLIEDLRSDSNLVKAIEKYQTEQAAKTTAQ